MKIAIHSSCISYSNKWVEYCKVNDIPYKIVNCLETDIVEQLTDCDALMWHYSHIGSRDILFARQLLFAMEAAGKKVYPDFRTGWFFDDKVGQKYLLEAIDAPLVPSYVFYSKSEALRWIQETAFPKVFKLRKGSSSANVRLVRNQKEARRLVNKAFCNGFRQYEPWGGLKERWRMFKQRKSNIVDVLEGVGRFFIKTRFERIAGRERGYIYFQDFIDGCTFDIRVTVVGDKCYAFRRLVRENDFRASGSHNEIYSPENIPLEVIKISFQISKKIGLQSMAFDFLITRENVPLITEISYAFGWDEGDAYAYWDSYLNWHNQPFNPFGEMIDNLIKRNA